MRKLALLTLLFFSLQLTGFAQADCAENESTIVVTVNTDGYGYETSWEVIDNSTYVIYDSVGVDTYDDGITYTHEFCIPQDACVNFTIRDSFGDGICCTYGQGSYEVTLDGNVIATGGEFGNSETVGFNCPPGTVCTSAIPVTEGDYTTASADYWYVFEPTIAGTYSISTCDLNNCNTKIWVYDNCTATGAESNVGTIYYNDNNPECGMAAFLEIPMGPPNIYYIRIGDAANDCENAGTIDWSLSYVGPVAGCTDPEACNYSPLATEDDGSCAYVGDEDCPGPDLVLLEDVMQNTMQTSIIDNADGCLIGEGCVSGYGERQLIRFTTHIKNIGATDYLIGAPDNDSDQFTYDNCHNHFHYDGYAEYILYDENSVETPAGFKNGFCVIDLECDDGGQAQYGCSYMGITAGCGDIYSAGLECQWIDITDTEDGTYTFVARVNWDNAPDLLGRHENDFSNNWAQACIEIYTEADGTRGFSFAQNCEPYVDCAGEVYGSAQPDCTGECNGFRLMGDLNADGTQAMEDAYSYVTQILGNDDISPTSCNDLNDDNQISVYDAALLASCLNYGATHVHPETNAHDHCDFPMGLTNPNDLVTLSINDINFTDQYIDIDVTNPDNLINAYQFTMSGVEIMSVENLVDPVMYPIMPSTAPGGDMVIGISYQDSLIIKSPIAQPLCRIHFNAITNDEICIASITSVVNQDYEQTMTEIGSDCLFVGITNPLTVIEANITPNPTKGDAVLTYPNTTNGTFTLKITDARGRHIRTYENLQGTQHTISCSDLAAGVYLYHLQSDTKTASGKLVVQ